MNNKPLITIGTSTYNRADTLPKLYQSLLDQTSSDFCWLIVDDGSTDDTESLVATFIEENKIPIQYIKKAKNQGLSRGQNSCALAAETDLLWIVDSDDWLFPDAVQKIAETWKATKDECVGIIAPYVNEDGNILGNWFPSVSFMTVWEKLFKYEHLFDSAHIDYTPLRKKYLMEVAEGEKYISETVSYFRLDEVGKRAVIQSPVAYHCYLEGGMSKSGFSVLRENPKSDMTSKKLRLKYAKGLPFKLRILLTYDVAAVLAKKVSFGIKDLEKKGEKFAAVLLLPVAFVLAKTYFQK